MERKKRNEDSVLRMSSRDHAPRAPTRLNFTCFPTSVETSHNHAHPSWITTRSMVPGYLTSHPRLLVSNLPRAVHISTDIRQIACPRSQQHRPCKISNRHTRDVFPRAWTFSTLFCRIESQFLQMWSLCMGAYHEEKLRKFMDHLGLARPLLGECCQQIFI